MHEPATRPRVHARVLRVLRVRVLLLDEADRLLVRGRDVAGATAP